MGSNPAQSALYTGIAPIINGDLHQARREALRTILLEAGQHGYIQITTQSTLVNMELSESVRLQSNAALQRFKIIQEVQEGNLLTLTADVELKNQPDAVANNAPVQLRNLRYQWLPPSPARDIESEVLLKLALKREIQLAFGQTLLDDNSAQSPAYQLTLQLRGEPGLFGANETFALKILGADGQPLIEETIPLPLRHLVKDETETQEGVSVVQKMIPQAMRSVLRQLSQVALLRYRGLPVIEPVPPGPREWIIRPTHELNPEAAPMLVFSKSWPVRPKGQVDMLKIDTFLHPKRLTPNQIVVDLPSNSAGYLLFQ